MIRTVRSGFLAILLLLAIFAAYSTRQWPLVGDASLMHYVAFLFDHGMVPYRQVMEINLPGAIFFDWLVIHLLGPGPIALRVADFGLLAAATLAMIVIARPYDRIAGVFGGVLLTAIHLRDGIDQTCERDLILATLLLIACAFLFEARRRERWWYSIGFGFAASCAILIKPTALLWIVAVLSFGLPTLRKRVWPNLIAAVMAMAVPLALTYAFLRHEQALPGLVAMLRDIVPYHTTIDDLKLHELLSQLLPSAVIPLLFVWLPLAFTNQSQWARWEQRTLLISFGFGLLSFALQGKGFLYHRYPAEAFLFVLLGIDACIALKRAHMLRLAGAALLLCGALIAATDILKASHYDWQNQDFASELSADLNRLGGPTLSNHVQCMDVYGGCINTLYDMQLVQATGYLYDCYYFHLPQVPASLALRDHFLATLEQAPPQIIVITDQLCLSEPAGYGKLDRWPAFRDWLGDHYILYSDRKAARPVAWWPHPKPPVGYRIYMKGEPEALLPRIIRAPARPQPEADAPDDAPAFLPQTDATPAPASEATPPPPTP